MNKLQQKLRTYLGIKEPIDYSSELQKAVEQYRHETNTSFENTLKELRATSCTVCDKGLIEGRDSIYTNFKGKKFCSHACIDKESINA